MKNFGFMIVALILGHTVSAQIQQESFDASEIPDGWIYEINSNATSWQFGYTGVMPHSGPTIESEFASGAALFNDNNSGNRSNDKTSLTTPAVDVSDIEEAQIAVTYNLQVEDDKGEFSIEVFNGKKWKEVYFQDSSSPKNTGMNEVVLLEVSEFLNDEFQVRFVYDDEGQNITQGLGIDHYELIDASAKTLVNENTIGSINVLNLPDNVLVLDSNEQLNRENMLEDLTEHLKSSELTTDSILYDLTRFPTGSEMFRVKEETNVGSYKALKK
jgi:hypothetical protein